MPLSSHMTGHSTLSYEEKEREKSAMCDRQVLTTNKMAGEIMDSEDVKPVGPSNNQVGFSALAKHSYFMLSNTLGMQMNILPVGRGPSPDHFPFGRQMWPPSLCPVPSIHLFFLTPIHLPRQCLFWQWGYESL